MEIIDISLSIQKDMILYPGDSEFQLTRVLDMTNTGDEVNLSKIEMSVHTGTHVESPLHFIEDGKTIVTSPHKVYGPESNDLILQLRKRGIDKVILAGMSSNLCVESHLRELLETGFEVAVVTDATAGAIVPDDGLDGYQAALTNFRFLANDLWTSEEAVKTMGSTASFVAK